MAPLLEKKPNPSDLMAANNQKVRANGYADDGTYVLPHLRVPGWFSRPSAEEKDRPAQTLSAMGDNTLVSTPDKTKLLPHLRPRSHVPSSAVKASEDTSNSIIIALDDSEFHLSVGSPSTAGAVMVNASVSPNSPSAPKSLSSVISSTLATPPSSFTSDCNSSPYKMIYVSPGVYIKQGPILKSLVIDLYACNVNTFCEDFSKSPSGCNKGNECKMVHDVGLREAYMKDLRSQEQDSKTAVFKSAGQPESRALITKKDDEKPKQNTVMSYAAVTAVGLPQPVPKPLSVRPKKLSWDQEELIHWARCNIPPTAVAELISTILYGSKPMSDCDSPKKDDYSFHKFSILPGEIRNKIWRFAMRNESAEVTVRLMTTRHGRIWLKPCDSSRSYMQVNRDARSLARHFWPRVLGTLQSKPKIQFNEHRDRLRIHNSSPNDLVPMVRHMHKRDLSLVHWISIPLRVYVSQPNITMSALCHFKCVEQIWFIAGDGYEDAPYVQQFNAEVLTSHLKHSWENIWREYPGMLKNFPVCDLDMIPALEAHTMKIDDLQWA